jgi:hypothetical protein
MGYHWSAKTSRAIDSIAEEAAREYYLDLDEFEFPEGDGLYTRAEALVIGLFEQVEEALKTGEGKERDDDGELDDDEDDTEDDRKPPGVEGSPLMRFAVRQAYSLTYHGARNAVVEAESIAEARRLVADPDFRWGSEERETLDPCVYADAEVTESLLS